MVKNCYLILGIDRTATDDMIRKAFRHLALRFHPDKNLHNPNAATHRFREISEAYEILSNKVKRTQHDAQIAFEHEASVNQIPLSRTGEDIMRKNEEARRAYRDAINMFNSFMDPKQNKKRKTGIPVSGNSGKRGKSITKQTVILTLEDLHTGVVKQFKVVVNGETVPLEIDFKPGSMDGDIISQYCQGTEFQFVVSQIPHARFLREGSDLVRKVQINLTEVLVGTEVIVMCLDGTQESFNTMEHGIVYPGYRRILPGKGMPSKDNPCKFGDMFIEFDVKFPVSNAWFLTDLQKEKIKNAHACFQSQVKHHRV